MHEGHRMRMIARFRKDSESLSSKDILEMLLYFVEKRRDVSPTAETLLERFGSLKAVMNAEPDALADVGGSGNGMALFVNIVGEIIRRIGIEQTESCDTRDIRQLADCLSALFNGYETERAICLLLDPQGRIKSRKTLSSGTSISTVLDTAEIVKYALDNNARSVILAHNHPFGICSPSKDDILSTQVIENALDAVGISLSEHAIVCPPNVYYIKSGIHCSTLQE